MLYGPKSRGEMRRKLNYVQSKVSGSFISSRLVLLVTSVPEWEPCMFLDVIRQGSGCIAVYSVVPEGLVRSSNSCIVCLKQYRKRGGKYVCINPFECFSRGMRIFASLSSAPVFYKSFLTYTKSRPCPAKKRLNYHGIYVIMPVNAPSCRSKFEELEDRVFPNALRIFLDAYITTQRNGGTLRC